MSKKKIEKSLPALKENIECSSVKELTNKITKRLIRNPLIIKNSMVHLRSYILVASTDPLIVYINPGFVTFIKHEVKFYIILKLKEKDGLKFYSSFEEYLNQNDMIPLENLWLELENKVKIVFVNSL